MVTVNDTKASLQQLLKMAVFDADKDDAIELLLSTAEKLYLANPSGYKDYFDAVAALRVSIKKFAIFFGDNEFDDVVRYYGMTQDMAVFQLKLATFKTLRDAIGVSVRTRHGFLF